MTTTEVPNKRQDRFITDGVLRARISFITRERAKSVVYQWDWEMLTHGTVSQDGEWEVCLLTFIPLIQITNFSTYMIQPTYTALQSVFKRHCAKFYGNLFSQNEKLY